MAYEFYVTIESNKSGKWKGESTRLKKENKIPGFFFTALTEAARDNATGQPTGKRRHSPVIMRKKIGVASPLFSKALTTNELLHQVVFEFFQTNKDGVEEIFYTVTLKSATVSAQKIYLPEIGGDKDHLELSEEIAFTFQRIEWNHVLGKTMHTDDWKA